MSQSQEVDSRIYKIGFFKCFILNVGKLVIKSAAGDLILGKIQIWILMADTYVKVFFLLSLTF
jgi:hypothetical protein